MAAASILFAARGAAAASTLDRRLSREGIALALLRSWCALIASSPLKAPPLVRMGQAKY